MASTINWRVDYRSFDRTHRMPSWNQLLHNSLYVEIVRSWRQSAKTCNLRRKGQVHQYKRKKKSERYFQCHTVSNVQFKPELSLIHGSRLVESKFPRLQFILGGGGGGQGVWFLCQNDAPGMQEHKVLSVNFNSVLAHSYKVMRWLVTRAWLVIRYNCEISHEKGERMRKCRTRKNVEEKIISAEIKLWTSISMKHKL